jgi:Raf kinase inhibitor-like YbhB/YbcL family protein
MQNILHTSSIALKLSTEALESCGLLSASSLSIMVGSEMIIESPAFEQHQMIPKKYTCEGEDLSPPLKFIDIPHEALSLVLIMDDPDAPMGTFDHWIAWNIPPKTPDLPEGATLPFEGKNGFGNRGYGGPCPPRGKPHRYFFKLYALNTKLNLPSGSSKSAVESTMKGHILEEASLVGTYQRSL